MATPVEHYETAEGLVAEVAAMRARLARTPGGPHVATNADELLAEALVHATLSNAPWALDDRILDEVAAGLDAETVGALLAVVRELAEWARASTAVPDGDAGEHFVTGIITAKDAVAKLVRPVLELVEAARA